MDEIRFNHYLPYSDNDSYDVVLNVQLPVTSIERITISIMSNENPYEESQEEMQPPALDYNSQDTGTTNRISSNSHRLQALADRRAIDDIDEVEKIIRRAGYIIINRGDLSDRAKLWAKFDIKDNDITENPHIPYPTLLKEYQNNYLRGFDKEIHRFADSVIETKDDEEEKLRTTLSQYRPQVQNRSQRDARDLVLICILQTYYRDCLDDLNIINVLSERHALIDKYEKFVRDSEEKHGESWPDPNSFRPTR